VFFFAGLDESHSLKTFENFEKMEFDGNYLINTGGVIVALAIVMIVLKLVSLLVQKLQILKVLDLYNKVYKLVFW